MAQNFKKKEYVIQQMHENFKKALSVVVASINGVKTNAINQLRKEARKFGVYVHVVPNSLLCRAILDTTYMCLKEIFIGQIVVAFSIQKPNDAACIFVKFSKDNEFFKIKGAAFEGNLISIDQVDLLSNLPSYKVLLLRLIYILQISSVGNLINVLKALSEQKLKL